MSDHTTSDHTTHDSHSDTVHLPVIGSITVSGGIYTVVFGILGVLTLLEVLIAETIGKMEGDTAEALKIVLLLGIAVAKSALVILYYMHLKDDSRIFLATLLLPLLITLLSIFYLLAVPPTGYSIG